MKTRTSIIKIMLICVLTTIQLSCAEYYTDEKFLSYSDQKLALLYYATKAYQSGGKERQKYLIKYFNAYPNTFEDFFKMLYAGPIPNNIEKDIYIEKCYEDTLYTVTIGFGYNFSQNPWCSTFYPQEKVVSCRDKVPLYPVSKRFKPIADNLQQYEFTHKIYYMLIEEMVDVIPFDRWCRKLINTSIGGFDLGDNEYAYILKLGFNVSKDYPSFIKILSEYTDDEIASFYYYRYDGIQLASKKSYKEHYEKVKAINPRVAHQITRAYEYLIEERKHGGDCPCCGMPSDYYDE